MLIPGNGGGIGEFGTTSIGGGGTLGIDKYMTFSPDYSAIHGRYKTRLVLGLGFWNFDFYIPADFLALQEIKLVGIANKNFTNEDIDLDSNYHGPGEDYQTHVESDTVTVSGIDNQSFDLDVSSVFTALSADDRCGLRISHNISIEIHYLFGLLVYS
jgi:hypothetical protein